MFFDPPNYTTYGGDSDAKAIPSPLAQYHNKKKITPLIRWSLRLNHWLKSSLKTFYKMLLQNYYILRKLFVNILMFCNLFYLNYMVCNYFLNLLDKCLCLTLHRHKWNYRANGNVGPTVYVLTIPHIFHDQRLASRFSSKYSAWHRLCL